MKRTIRNITIALFVVNGLIFKLNAQDTKVTRDMEQWTSIELSKKISKRWEVSLAQEFRFTHDASQFEVYFADLGVDFKINKHFYVGANYRFYQNKNKVGIFITQHRWNTDFQYKQKLSRFSISYRVRFQNKDEDFYISNSANNLYYLRNKFSVDYNINNFKMDPFFNVEIFRQIYNVSDSEFNKLRWTIGVEYPLSKYGDLELFYSLDNELNQSYNKHNYIIGLGYKFSF